MVELADIVARHGDDFGMTVPEDGAHLARGEVEDPADIGVGEPVALGALGNQRCEGAAIAHEMRIGFRPEVGIGVLAHADFRAALTSGRRSLPKNIELPTNIVGLPKPPRSISSSVLARSLALQESVSMPAKNRWRSRPARAAMSASASSRAMSRSSLQ